MRRKSFILAWYSLPLLPISVYGIRLSGIGNAYFLSVALGLAAYTWFCGLLVLNSKPAYALEVLGEEGLFSLMARTPLLILCLSVVHSILKVGLLGRPWMEALPGGFLASLLQIFRRGLVQGEGGMETSAGSVLIALLLVFTALGLLFLYKKARTGSGLGRLRAFLFTSQGWTAWGSLILYVGTLSVCILSLWHILGASSTSFSAHPIGAILLLGELAYGLLAWIGARIREGWKAPKPTRLKGRPGSRG